MRFPKDRMVVIGHVAGGIDAWDVGFAVLVHEDPIADLQAAAGREVDDRFDADPDNREITIDPTTAFRDDALDAPLSLEAASRHR